MTRISSFDDIRNSAGLSDQSLSAVSDIGGVQTQSSFISILLSAVQIGLQLLALAAFLMLFWTGIQITLGQKKWEDAKGLMINIFIGFVIILASYAFVSTVIETLSDPNANSVDFQ